MAPVPLRRLLLLLFFNLLYVIVSGPAAAASSPSHLVGKPEIFPNKDELLLDSGDPLNLTCRASYPVAWCSAHPFTEEQYEEKYEEGHDKPYISVLTIDAVYASHVGYFSCVFNTTENKENATCDVNDPKISSIYLYVKDVEQLMVKQTRTHIQAAVGETVLIPCKPTFPQVNITLHKNFDLYICEYEEECTQYPREGFAIDFNEYAFTINCTASYNDHDNTGKNYEFFVESINKSAKKPRQPMVDVEGYWQEDTQTHDAKYYVTEGSTINLTCISNSKNSRLNLHWTTNSNNETGTHTIIRHSDINTPHARYYQIRNTKMEDSGTYSCYAKLYKKYSEYSNLEIIVIGKDEAYLNTTIFNPNVTSEEMNTLIYWEVLFIAHPEPIFRWMKEGKLLRESTIDTSRDQFRNYEMSVRVQEGSVSLYLHHPTLADNGMYTLEASINGTDITTITTMYLLLSGKPQNVMIKSPSDERMLKEGYSFSLTCTAEGYPKPELSLDFIPDKSVVTQINSFKPGERYNMLREVRGEDAEEGGNMVEQNKHWMGIAQTPGTYQCKAVNKLGIEFSSWTPFLVTDGESLLAISLKLEIGGEMRNVIGNSVDVVEGDDFKLTCRANKMLTTAPLTWTLNDRKLTNAVMKNWGIKVAAAEDTSLSLVSTLIAPRLRRMQNKFSIKCVDKKQNYTDLLINIKEMVKPTWKIKYPGKDYEKLKNENMTLSCPAYGTPLPRVIWRKGDHILEENHRMKIKNNHDLFFEILLPSDYGKYTCEITNRAGNLSASFNVAVKDPDRQRTMVILAVVVVLIAALVIVSVFFCRKIYQARKETLDLQLREQRMFMEGDPSSLSPDLPLEQQAELLPYNTKYEVTRDSIIFDKLLGSGAFGRVYRATALNLLPGEARTTVAVKMIKSRTDSAQLKALRSEVKIMIHIGRHINIVNLLGACSKDLASKGELLLVVEYCKHGNILDYMRRRRKEFVNQINDEDKIDPMFREPRPRHRSDSSSRSHASRSLKYAHLNFHQDNVFYGADHQTSNGATRTAAAAAAATRPSSHLSPTSIHSGGGGGGGSEGGHRTSFRPRTLSASSNNQHVASDNSYLSTETSGGTTTDGYLSLPSQNGSQAPLCSTDLLEWAYQIAKGMEYLAFKKVLHGDLAARNVLLADNNVVKISDFGLAKDIYKNENYRRRTNGPVPVKWLAVECLRDGVFSTQSDVWSFGVVLWEIFSLGQIPYSCTEFNEAFILRLEKGIRLEQPRYATYGLYRLMLECWNSEPMERPNFTSLENSLGEMIGEAQKQNYLQLTEPYQNFGSSEFLDMLPSQDYSAKVRQTTPQLTEDGYEMPFSPSAMPPQVMVPSDKFSKASRLTTQQMEYVHSAEDDNSSCYVPMSADRTDNRIVFDFDNKTVQSFMAQSEKEEEDEVDGDMYLKMDSTPKNSPAADTTIDAIHSRQTRSPRRIILKSVSSQDSQRDKHPSVTKHDSGVYSPTVLMQTNPGYMTMTSILSTDDSNYINTEATEASTGVYINYDNNNKHTSKTRDYMNEGKCNAEYANLLSHQDKTESDTSSGMGSLEEGESPPRATTDVDKFNVSPIPEESVVV